MLAGAVAEAGRGWPRPEAGRPEDALSLNDLALAGASYAGGRFERRPPWVVAFHTQVNIVLLDFVNLCSSLVDALIRLNKG